MKRSELEKIILEQYAQVSESKKIDELPKAFKDAIEKRYGEIHPKDFFSDDLTRYMKFDGENKTTGQVTHKVIALPSFNKMYDNYQGIVDDIKVLMRSKDIRTDKAARELFELIKTNFRKLQRYLRIERPDQYAVIRNRVALQELVDLFKTHASIIAEEKNILSEVSFFESDTEKINSAIERFSKESSLEPEFIKKNLLIYFSGDKEDTQDKTDPKVLSFIRDVLYKFTEPRVIKAYLKGERLDVLKENLLDELEEQEDEPTPEEEGEEEGAVLEDATDTILGKFPTLKAAIIKLQTDDFKEFVDKIDWISPRPTSFRINLKNGQDYILKWTGKTFEAQIMGKKYLLSNIADYQQALDKLAVLYKEAPMTGAGEEPADVDTGGGGGGGGGDFPGDDAAGGGEEGGDDVDALGGGEEGGGADLGGEEIDFEEPAEEPEA